MYDVGILALVLFVISMMLVVFAGGMSAACKIAGKRFFNVKDWGNWLGKVLFLYLYCILFFVLFYNDPLASLLFIPVTLITYRDYKRFCGKKITNSTKNLVLDIVSNIEKQKGYEPKIINPWYFDAQDYYNRLIGYYVVCLQPNIFLFCIMFIKNIFVFSKNKLIYKNVFDYSLSEAEIVLLNVSDLPDKYADNFYRKMKNECQKGCCIISIGKPLLGFRLKEDFSGEGIFVYEV